ncbi:hypothetical protein SGL43_02431 [Streptomyces globisporus]|uniref:Ubiquitin-like protease family profile domain-containing protein n=1 Tax=Streptomyces globisporus TaxID=1908 RepID=A0ABN8V0F4_STRGL|nr:hypothetical protein SGL43_02431 [Streptomyces globisporus]
MTRSSVRQAVGASGLSLCAWSFPAWCWSRGSFRHFRPQVTWSAPRFSSTALVAHPVAVGAQEGQIVQPGFARSGHVERQAMVHLDVPRAQVTVDAAKIKIAYFALQGLSKLRRLSDLASTEPSVTFAMQRPAREKAAFDCGISLIIQLVRILRNGVKLPCTDSLAQRGCGKEHLCRPGDEGADRLPVQAAPLRRCADVRGVVRGQVGGLAADAADGAELRDGACSALVDGQGPEEVRQIRYSEVALAELAPAVLDYESAGKQQLVLGPCRASRHGPYRMSVRCHVWGGRSVVVRDAHLKAIALSVGSVTLCDGWREPVPVGHVRKEGV